jgi:drug/metabolite transporter (DMT)-like permease
MERISRVRQAAGATLIVAGTLVAMLHRSPTQQAIIAAIGVALLAAGTWASVRPRRQISDEAIGRIMHWLIVTGFCLCLFGLAAALVWTFAQA